MARKSLAFAICDEGVNVNDLALVKSIQPCEIITVEVGKYKDSDHTPIFMDLHFKRQTKQRNGRISKHA